MLQKPKGAAVDGGQDSELAASPAIDPADLKNMKASAFGKKYGYGVVEAYLAEKGVVYDGRPSLTQLASLALQTAQEQ